MADQPTLSVGDPAPDITLQGIGGKEWSLADQKGKKNVVLLFYVLDWTPG
jgi:peroxiredoxin